MRGIAPPFTTTTRSSIPHCRLSSAYFHTPAARSPILLSRSPSHQSVPSSRTVHSSPLARLYPCRSLPHYSSLLAFPHALSVLVHLIHCRSPSPFIAAAAPFIATLCDGGKTHQCRRRRSRPPIDGTPPYKWHTYNDNAHSNSQPSRSSPAAPTTGESGWCTTDSSWWW